MVQESKSKSLKSFADCDRYEVTLFQASKKHPIFLILYSLGVKLMVVDKPQIPTNIPFYGSMYEP